MLLEDLKSGLDGNTLSYSNIRATELANIMKFVDVKLNIDKTTLDYFYEIYVDDLLRSEIPNDEIETLKNQGWSFSNDNKKLLLYLKNN